MIPELVWVDPSAVIAPDVQLAPFVYVGARVRIGAGTKLAPGVVILEDCEIGNRVIIGAGTAIGIDGFGYIRVGERYQPIPHTGRVIIEDDVTIGANCTIARARSAATRIGTGTKIDSLVHIAHNVTIGRNCLIIAQTGIAGSARLGDNVILAGQVGIKDHVVIGDNSIIYAKSALFRSVPVGARYSGIPARPHHQNLRALARLHRND